MAAGPGGSYWSQTDWYSLSHIIVLVTVVTLLLRSVVKAALKSRAENVRSKLVETKKELARLDQEILTARDELANIDAKKKEFVEKVEHEGRKLSEKMIQEAEETSARILEDARLTAQSEADELRSRLRQEVVEDAIQKASTHLSSESGRLETKKIHDQLVDRFVREASRAFHV